MIRRYVTIAAAGCAFVLGFDYMLTGIRLMQLLREPPAPELVFVGSRDDDPPDVRGFTGLPTTPAPDTETTP